MLTLLSVGMWAQTTDDELMRKALAMEAKYVSTLDTVKAVIFNEDFITDTYWKSEFSTIMSDRPMDTTGWEQTLSWLLPDDEKDVAKLSEASAEGIYIDVQSTGNTYEKYVRRLKAHGYTSDASESGMDGTKLFEARNTEGNRQCAVMRYDDGSLTVSIEPSLTDEELKNHNKKSLEDKEEEFDDLLKDYL